MLSASDELRGLSACLQGEGYIDILLREKGRDLIQSYDKSPYIEENIKRQNDNTKRH